METTFTNKVDSVEHDLKQMGMCCDVVLNSNFISKSVEDASKEYSVSGDSQTPHNITYIAFNIFLVALFASFALYAQNEQPMIGQPAPSFTLPGIDGKMYSLEQVRGKYVVIHFAATWCPFCNAEAPYLEQLYKDYLNKNVQVFIIDVKESKELAAKLSQKFNFTFPILLDEGGTISTRYAPEGVLPDLPRDEVPLASNLIIDKEGNIRFYSLLNTTDFDAKLTRIKQKLDELLSKTE